MKNLAIILGSIIGLTIIGATIIAIIMYVNVGEEEFSRASVKVVLPLNEGSRSEIVS